MLLKNKPLEEIIEFTELGEKEINDIKQHIEDDDRAAAKEEIN